jgi:hypothetical protein
LIQSGRLYYNASNADGCLKGGTFADDFIGDPEGVVSPIFMVERGNCTFATKVRNIA